MRKNLLAVCLVTLFNITYAEDNDYLFATESWPPYYDDTLKNGGFFAEIVKEAYRSQGKKVRIVFTSWKRAFELTKQGKYQGLLGAYYVPEREQYFKYSSVICHSRQYLYSKKSSNISFTSLQELSQYKIGIVRGYYYSDEFNDAKYLDKFENVSAKQNIKLLTINRLDLVTADSRVMQYYASTAFPSLANQYKQHPLMIKDITVHLVISKAIPNTDQLHLEFELGFALLKKQGLDKAIMRTHGFSP
ncbi:transporter substrate-binding domain-containing protein [Endozoicomonas sp. SM1973]|uniref:Transporter substrate-binding domain-containing protein n=1 Tax=Spartinivicinus marinus TaxID=2994442 RepID=A0A853I6H7_9GAMM|nr:transporter substrate-binding domain-containing protein [Spartinivicinus marinus]MCX4026822.1 transporter substrate-binding domain-containing protein [Spartinivicinus marinus]NYZ69510.1 transporter substrate-binding domain-containing protein [Spartinivicinus marinus]